MPLEPTFDNIDDLDPANPFADDPVSEGDDHLRGIKKALQANVTGDDLETRLMVASVIRAFVDASRLTAIDELLVKGALLDVDSSAIDQQTVSRIRNLIGGWSLGVNAGTGRLQWDQISASGLFENIAMTLERDGKSGLRFDGTEVFQTTVGNVHNSRAEIKDDAGLFKAIGYNVMPTDAGGNPTSFTLDSTFNGRRIRPNATITITVVGSSLPTDGVVVISNQGAGLVTFSGTGGVQFTLFLNGSTSIVTSFTMIQGQIITLTRLQATNTYEVWGTFQP